MAPYHHGNLKARLLERAREYLDSAEPGDAFPDLSLRQLARDLGVSPTAVYHHFDSKDALLAAVACEVLRGLAETLESLPLEAQGLAYLEYFSDQPVMLDLVFGPSLRSNPEVQALQDRAYAALDSRLPPAVPGDEPHAAGLLIWALVHGLSQLYRTGALGPAAIECPGTPGLWLGSPAAILSGLSPLIARALGQDLTRRRAPE